MPRTAQRRMIDADLFSDLLNALTQKVGQDMGANLARLAPGGRVARRGDPDLELRRNRARLCHHTEAAGPGREIDLLAPPQTADLINPGEHGGAVVGRGILGAQHEIIGLPAACHRKARAPVGQVVDHRPIFGHARRVMQRQHDRPGPHPNAFRHRRDGRPGHAGVRIGAAKGVEVAFRRPDRAEPVTVGEFGTFQQQFVFLRPRPVIIAPVVKRELHPLGRGDAPVRHQRPVFVAGQHQLEAAGQCPEQLQHRNVEGERGDRQPDRAFGMVDTVIHARKEIGHVAMFDHHALGPPGRARGIDHIGQIRGTDAGLRVFNPGARKARVGIKADHRRAMRRQLRGKPAVGHHHRAGAVFQIKRGAVGRIGRVHRHIGAPGLLNGQRPHQKVKRAAHMQPHQRSGLHPHADQHMSHLIGAGVQLGIGQRLALEHHGRGLGRAGDLRLKGLMHAKRGVIGFGGAIGRFQRRDPLCLGQDGQGFNRRIAGCGGDKGHQPRRQRLRLIGGQTTCIKVQRSRRQRDHRARHWR